MIVVVVQQPLFVCVVKLIINVVLRPLEKMHIVIATHNLLCVFILRPVVKVSIVVVVLIHVVIFLVIKMFHVC